MKNSPILAASVSSDEVEHFSKYSSEWWVSHGIFSSLHDLMPPRLSYVKSQCDKFFALKNNFSTSLEGLQILDIGCGGGLMTEALCQKGAQMVGVDACAESIEVARAHAVQGGLNIDYRVSTAEALRAEKAQFDVILALEIVEHVADLDSFIKALSSLLKPEGIVIFSTLNRTRQSFLLGVVIAEYVLGWIPAGTHDYNKFIRPSELARLCEKNNLMPMDVTGLVYRPLRRFFELCKEKTKVNYFLTAKKK